MLYALIVSGAAVIGFSGAFLTVWGSYRIYRRFSMLESQLSDAMHALMTQHESHKLDILAVLSAVNQSQDTTTAMIRALIERQDDGEHIRPIIEKLTPVCDRLNNMSEQLSARFASQRHPRSW